MRAPQRNVTRKLLGGRCNAGASFEGGKGPRQGPLAQQQECEVMEEKPTAPSPPPLGAADGVATETAASYLLASLYHSVQHAVVRSS